ncbi:MAG: DinB family protein [Anaerolineae bacterium]|nr:DinB family protein [Anaerolineae bacterium]
MDKTYFLRQYDYNFWAHRQVWNCVMQLTDEQFNQHLDYSIGSIRIQCIHTMAVESWWFEFLRRGELVFMDMVDFPTRAEIRTRWDEVETSIRAYLERLTPAEMEREVRPHFWDETRQPIKVWEAILQVANHSTDHRAQTLAGLHRLGAPTVGQDFLDYLFAQQATKKRP